MTQTRPTGSFRRQLVVVSATITAIAAVLLALIVHLVLSQTSSRSINRVLEERAEAVISSAVAASSSTQLVVPDGALDAGVAVYDGEGTLVAGNVPSALAEQYAELVAAGRGTRSVGETRRIRAQPFTLDSGVEGIVVVTERLGPYEEAEHYALLVSGITGVLAVLASAALAAWVSRRALAPVAAMASTAADWSEHDLDRRFELGAPTNEITALGNTLDTLLDKVGAAILSEQRLTAELAHELRTPLTAIQGTADLLAMRGDLSNDVRAEVEEIRAGSRRMGETITGLLHLARSGSSGRDAVATDVRRLLVRLSCDMALPVQIDVADDVLVALDETLVTRAVGPVLENALRVAGQVRVSIVDARGGLVGIAIEDDGAGVDLAVVDRVFEPGLTSGDHGGAGLGLPLARRIARSAGGDVRLDSPRNPTRFVVELPRA
ncbi:MAG: HAMP domain-containing sensor histidine kinase [Propionibacteriales bacterium]|nr:HAMP domain-containing sensor histidine kinase [Propionibacteriales bacterium]